MNRELETIERALAGLFPELAISPLRTLDTGFGSVAVETSDGVIFRIARHERAAEGHARERRLLPILRARLPVDVPEPRWRVEPGSSGIVHGAIGYRKLPGETLSDHVLARADVQKVAADLADFLVALHRFPVAEAEAAGVPRGDRHGPEFEALRDDVLPLLSEALEPTEYAAVCAWCDEVLSDAGIDRFEPVLRHGDLWFGNVLVDETTGSISGVVDWENAAIGDSAKDLARQLHLGELFAGAVLRAYEARRGPLDRNLRHRIRRRWEILEFEGVRGAVHLDDSAEFDEAIEKLRAGPILRVRDV